MVKIIESYTLHEQIGEGEYGKVYRGVDGRNGKVVAVKVVNVKRFKENPKLEECTLNEIEVLSKIESPSIIRFIEILKTINNFYFFYEYCNGGTLDQEIRKSGHLPETKINEYLEQLLEAFRILVANNIMHRDLKPSNIMIHNGRIKLGDFGFCKSLESQRDLAQTMLGSPIYMAPEILKGEIYTIKADIWSLGVVIYEMAFGFCPFEESSIAKLINMLEHQQLSINTHINPISPALEALIKKCLVKDHFKRIAWEELLNYQTKDGRLERPSHHAAHHTTHQRALSELNRTQKRESDLAVDKHKRTEDLKFFKKKVKAEDDYQNDELHSCIGEVIRTVDKFIAQNACPEITLYLALKCYRMVEREHRKLGSKYLRERVDITEAVIQVEALMDEDERALTDDTVASLVRQQYQPRSLEALARLLKLTGLNEKPQLCQSWTRQWQREFVEANLISHSAA